MAIAKTGIGASGLETPNHKNKFKSPMCSK